MAFIAAVAYCFIITDTKDYFYLKRISNKAKTYSGLTSWNELADFRYGKSAVI